MSPLSVLASAFHFVAPSPDAAPAPTTAESSVQGDRIASKASKAPKEPRSDDSDDKKKKKANFEWGAQIMGGYEARTRTSEPFESPTMARQTDTSSSFFLRQARVRLKASYGEHLSASISMELADALSPYNPDRIRYLRNAYANIRIIDAFQIRLGHYKRPFSRLELEGSRELPIRSRGLFNSYFLEDRDWGDRALGMMLWGEASEPKLRWAVHVGAPDWSGNNLIPTARGVDVFARMEISPFSWLSVGTNAAYKRLEHRFEGGKTHDLFAAGGDLRIDARGFTLLAEANAAQNHPIGPAIVPAETGNPFGMSALGLAWYDIDLPKKLILQPVVLGEWADADLRYQQSEAMRAMGGVNVLWRRRVRVMPQVDVRRPLNNSVQNPWGRASTTFYVMLSLQI